MNKRRNVKSYFIGVLENIDLILKNGFYKNDDKLVLKKVKLKVKKWYKSYIENETLTKIKPEVIKYIELEITDFFDKYITTEPVKENYAERLSYDFGCLEKKWKDEMLGGKINGR